MNDAAGWLVYVTAGQNGMVGPAPRIAAAKKPEK